MTVRHLFIPYVELHLVLDRQVDFVRWSVVLVVGNRFEHSRLGDFVRLAVFGHILWEEIG